MSHRSALAQSAGLLVWREEGAGDRRLALALFIVRLGASALTWAVWQGNPELLW